MRARIRPVLLATAVVLAAGPAVLAQYVPPGATLPGGGIAPGPGYRPPGATQPDTGMIEPGPGYRPPGATVPRAMMPSPPPRAIAPQPRLQPLPRNFPSASPPPAARQAARERAGGRPYTPAKSLKECLSRWSPKERISQSAWEAACRRLEVSGRATGR